MRVLLLADKKKSSQTSEVWKLEEILGISLYTVLREHLPQNKCFLSALPEKGGGLARIFGPPCSCTLYFDINIMLCDTFWSFLTSKSSKVPKL